MNKEYVYVLMSGCIDDYNINSIYSSKKKAEQVEIELKNDNKYQGEIWIEAWEVK